MPHLSCTCEATRKLKYIRRSPPRLRTKKCRFCGCVQPCLRPPAIILPLATHASLPPLCSHRLFINITKKCQSELRTCVVSVFPALPCMSWLHIATAYVTHALPMGVDAQALTSSLDHCCRGLWSLRTHSRYSALAAFPITHFLLSYSSSRTHFRSSRPNRYTLILVMLPILIGHWLT